MIWMACVSQSKIKFDCQMLTNSCFFPPTTLYSDKSYLLSMCTVAFTATRSQPASMGESRAVCLRLKLLWQHVLARHLTMTLNVCFYFPVCLFVTCLWIYFPATVSSTKDCQTISSIAGILHCAHKWADICLAAVPCRKHFSISNPQKT